MHNSLKENFMKLVRLSLLTLIFLLVSSSNQPIAAQTSNELVDQGNVLLGESKYPEALEKYSKAIELDATNKYAYGNRGLAKRNLKKYKDAIKDYDEALRIDPSFAWALASRADAKVQLKKYDEALLDLNQAITLEPTNAYTYIVRGDVYTNQNKLTEAEIDYSQAVSVNPDYAWAYIARGDARVRLHQYQLSLEDYDKAIELDPKLGWAYFRRGTDLYLLESYASAKTDFEKAIELSPQDKFMHVWKYFCENKISGKKVASDNLKAYWNKAKTEKKEFVGFIIRHLTGELTDVQVVDSAQTFKGQGVPENLCEGSFYIGMNAFVKGNEKLARQYWTLCLKTNVTNYIEYNYAGTYLGQLKKE